MAFIDVPVGDGSNLEQAFALRPEVYAAWQQLNGAIKAGMDLRRYELVTLAAARRLRSSYCALAHGSVLASQFDRDRALAVGALAILPKTIDPVDLAGHLCNVLLERDAALAVAQGA